MTFADAITTSVVVANQFQVATGATMTLDEFMSAEGKGVGCSAATVAHVLSNNQK